MDGAGEVIVREAPRADRSFDYGIKHVGLSENEGYLILGVLIIRILLFRVLY